MASQLEGGRRPRLFQADPNSPILRAAQGTGRDIECPKCEGVVLLAGVGDDVLFDIDVVCSSCGGVVPLPAFPPGRGLGGVVRYVRRDHHFVGTFVLEMDEVVVGPRAARQRAGEIALNREPPNVRHMDIAGMEEVIADARSTFAPVIEALRHRRGKSTHPLLQMIRQVQNNVDDLRVGGDVVDIWTLMSLIRATAVFAAWSGDPSFRRVLQECAHPESFDHNAVLLHVAGMLEAVGLAPELVPPNAGRTADVILRVSASRLIDLDVKAPQAMRFRHGTVTKVVDPRRTIRRALRSSRGQFARDGILVIAGAIWVDGIDAYAGAAERLLAEPLPNGASPEARTHYARLLGIVFASTGYENLGRRSFRPRLFMRWVPNPRYAGEIELALPRDVEGAFNISFQMGSKTSSAEEATRTPAFDTRRDSARFRVSPANEVEVAGKIVNRASKHSGKRTLVWRFPKGQRPDTDIDFDVACETGFTTVTVQRDGAFLADPSVGWIDLTGVRFTIR